MNIPTKPIGSIPRMCPLIELVSEGNSEDPATDLCLRLRPRYLPKLIGYA